MMKTPSDIVRDHRNHYIARLLGRSPLLYFCPKSTRLDLLTVLLDSSPSKMATPSSGVRDPSSTSCDRLLRNLFAGEIDRYQVKIGNQSTLAQLDRIRSKAEESRRIDGQHALYIGYPLLYAPNTGKAKPILAPLFFIPIQLKIQRDSIEVSRLRTENGSLSDQFLVRPNLMLESWVQAEHRIDLRLSDAAELFVNSELSGKSAQEFKSLLLEAATTALGSWKDLEGIQDLDPSRLEIAPSRDLARGWNKEGKPARMLNSAIVGLVDFKGQALLADLIQLEERVAGDPELSGVLRYFLNPREDEAIASVVPAPDEVSKWLVASTDPSQERAIWQSRTADLMVIQGPPGTGKSQTIVNLIADALAHRKSVVVICQKRTALEVIRKRLQGVGLHELSLLIDDPEQQRLEIVKGLKDIRDWDNPGRVSLNQRRSDCAARIATYEHEIETSMKCFEAEAVGSFRYGDYQARLNQLQWQRWKGNIGWRELLKSLRPRLQNDRRSLNDIIEDYAEFSNEASQSEYFKSPWRSHRTDIAIDRDRLETSLNQVLALVNSSGPSEATDHGRLHELSWCLNSPYMKPYYSQLLPSNYRVGLGVYQGAAEGLRYLSDCLQRPSQWIKDMLDSCAGNCELAELKAGLPRAPMVRAFSRRLQADSVGGVLEKYFPEYVLDWPKVIESAAHACWLGDLRSTGAEVYDSVEPVKQNLVRLRGLLKEKQDQDAGVLKDRYSQRTTFADQLSRKDLVRLRGNPKTGVRKTELRDLFVQGQDALGKLYPILLTSPEVACGVLPLVEGIFDMVIIDEASQMYTAEALPLMYRAKSVVITGDSNQMPPSDFFHGSEDDECEEDNESEQEELVAVNRVAAHGEYCLLDAAENALPKNCSSRCMLNVHYRSAASELIEFSNHALYNGRLNVIPANASKNRWIRPIRYCRVSGQYKEGKNLVEAKAIVEELANLWRDPQGPSIGVIVFSISQKAAVDEELRAMGQRDAAFQQRLDTERERVDEGTDASFFVRSVEHVQGDERDLIILGTTYADNSRRFGPLTTEDRGRKRLNVAITRAKEGMLIISSLNIESMASDASSGKDGWLFQQFLRYAKAVSDGNRQEIDAVLSTVNPDRRPRAQPSECCDSPFEDEVYRFLVDNGFCVDCQVGEAGFKIDLAVKRKDNRGYLCGIECDGAAFHTGWSARKRDIWRQDILEGKGWKILRIWSTDWFREPDKEKARILGRLQELNV